MSTTSESRRSRFRVQSDNVFGVARSIAQLTSDVSDMANAPVVSQVASLVLSVLDIVKEVKDNNDHRVRLATSAATYLIELKRILDPRGLTAESQDSGESQEEIPLDLQLRLETFHDSLLGVKNYLEAMKKRNILKHIFGKDRISTTLLERERALQDSYNALLLWTTSNTYTLLRQVAKGSDTDDIPRFDRAQVFLMGSLKATGDFFSKLQLAELRANGDRQRVLVKRFENKTERDNEAKKWRKLWHANLPQLAGCSNDRSAMQFILFHDAYHTSQPTAEIRSLAAFLLEFSKAHDAFSFTDKMISFVNDAISAVRHMQAMLNYDEDETGLLAWITKFTIGCDGRIIVTPPLQALAKEGYGVSNSIFNNLFPPYGTSEASMRRYFAKLDSVPTHAALSEVLDGEQLEKWAALNGIRLQIRSLPDGYEKPRQYVMPETRLAYVDYSIDIEPGDFGVLVPGERQEYAFRRIGNSAAYKSALFEYQSGHWLDDRNNVQFEVVCEQPLTWRLDRLTDGCFFFHQHGQKLTHAVHRSKRFLQLSAPKDCDVDELIFVVGTSHFRGYQYNLRSDESQVADIYANVPYWKKDKLRFSHCAPRLCPDSCDYPLDSRVKITRYNEIMRIQYVKVPVQRRTARLDAYVENFEDCHKIGAFRHKEYESIIQHRSLNEEWFWAEWP